MHSATLSNSMQLLSFGMGTFTMSTKRIELWGNIIAATIAILTITM